MTKAELIEKLQKGAGKDLSKKELSILIDEVFDHISKSVKKDKRFVYPGFGTFQLRKRARIAQTESEAKYRSIPAVSGSGTRITVQINVESETTLERLEPPLRRLVALPAEGLPQQVQHGEERRVLTIRRAAGLEPRV